MYKKALSSFFLKVHPDFFHFNPSYQRVNEAAVAQLNELLGWAKEFKKGAFRQPPANKIDFTFYRRVEEEERNAFNVRETNETSSFLQSSTSSSSSGGTAGALEEVVVKLHSRFELPSNFKPQEGTRGMVERSVNKFLRDLLRRAECLDAVTESISVSEDKTAERQEERPLLRRPRPTTWKDGSRRPLSKNKGGTTREDHHGSSSNSSDGGPRTLLDEAADSFRSSPFSWSSSPSVLPKPPTLEDLMSADQIFFSTSLSPLQCAAALYTLRENLPALEYHKWDSMPVVVGHQFEVSSPTTSFFGANASVLPTNESVHTAPHATTPLHGDPPTRTSTKTDGTSHSPRHPSSPTPTPMALQVDTEEKGAAHAPPSWSSPLSSLSSVSHSGSAEGNRENHTEGPQAGISGGFTVPWDFTPEQFLAFLRRSEAALQLCRVQIEQRATAFEQLLGELCHTLRWDDILVSCAHREAFDVMQLLSRHSALLEAVGVTDLTIELGDHYATRGNGVLIIDVYQLKNVACLRAWLSALQPKLKLQKELYRVCKQLLETTMWYVKEVEKVLQLSPGQIDVFEHNDCTYAERLQWIKEMFRISAGLSKWDWSDFKFILSPKAASAVSPRSSAKEEQKRSHLRRHLQSSLNRTGGPPTALQEVHAPDGDRTKERLESNASCITNNDEKKIQKESETQSATWEESTPSSPLNGMEERQARTTSEREVVQDETEEEDDEEEREPIMDLNWAKQVMMLPYQMDGDAFLRYVEAIQQEAKMQHRAALEEAQQANRAENDMAKEAAHRREMLLEPEQHSRQTVETEERGIWGSPGNASSSSGVGGAYTSSMHPPSSLYAHTARSAEKMDVVYPSAADVLFSEESALMSASPTSMEEDLPQHGQAPRRPPASSTSPRPPAPYFPPYMEEYTVSSKIGDPDALTVERPLQHQDSRTAFASDEAAEDQLKWEGFYQSPFVDQVPTGDLDDMSHAYHITNRAHREAAAKKLLEELQGTYGKKSRRFDYQKMGDVLEINNARVQPKGFPVLAKGVRPGSGV